jgi:serine/threonine protein kinase
MIRSPLAFLRFVAKAALNAVGGGVAGDFAVEVLPDVARDVWEWWGKNTPQEQLREELQQVAQLSVAEAQRQAEQVVAEEASGRPNVERGALVAYLSQVPASIRQSQRRLSDPTGRTVTSGLLLDRSESLVPLLPAKLPRFKPGERPPGIGDWQLEELLGVGGFGEVWRARSAYVPEPVALKFCLDPKAAQWLKHEAALLGRVMKQGTAPGIVRLRHTYLNAETPCLEYEYVPGGDLCGLINQWRDTPPADLVGECNRLMRQLADIVGFAHRLDPPIVHRDLKPANILLQKTDDGSVRPRVADFGIGGLAANQAIAKTRPGTTQDQLMVSTVRGSYTPLYASPQQMRGERPDPRDDVYALGVIWYQLLTRDPAVGAPTGLDWVDDLRASGMKEDLVRLLGSCVASQPNNRPADGRQLFDLMTKTPPPPPSIHIKSLRPESVSLRAGSSTSVVVRVTRQNFDGPLTVGVEDLPPTFTSRALPFQVGGTESQVHLTADQNAAPGTANAQIVVQGNGVQDRAMLPVQVTPPPPPPSGEVAPFPPPDIPLTRAILMTLRANGITTVEKAVKPSRLKELMGMPTSAGKPFIPGVHCRRYTTINSIMNRLVSNGSVRTDPRDGTNYYYLPL